MVENNVAAPGEEENGHRVRYPPKIFDLDFETLEKGVYLDEIRLEQIIGIPTDHGQYPFRLMELTIEIEARTTIVVKGEGGGLRLLTDVEALEYVPRQHESGLRRMVKNMFRMGAIDSSEMSEAQKRQLETQMRMMSLVTQRALVEKRRFLTRLSPGVRKLLPPPGAEREGKTDQ